MSSDELRKTIEELKSALGIIEEGMALEKPPEEGLRDLGQSHPRRACVTSDWRWTTSGRVCGPRSAPNTPTTIRVFSLRSASAAPMKSVRTCCPTSTRRPSPPTPLG